MISNDRAMPHASTLTHMSSLGRIGPMHETTADRVGCGTNELPTSKRMDNSMCVVQPQSAKALGLYK
jgi:hypothetical protein